MNAPERARGPLLLQRGTSRAAGGPKQQIHHTPFRAAVTRGAFFCLRRLASLATED
jgi:hypothetical protein